MSADIATRCARVAVFALLAAAAGCRTVNDVMVDYRANLSRGEYAGQVRNHGPVHEHIAVFHPNAGEHVRGSRMMRDSR